MKKYFILILTILWAGTIFHFSSDNKEKSASKSYYIAEKVNPLINDATEKINIKNIDLKEINHIIRKIAHFINYTILGILLTFNIKNLSIKNKLIFVLLLGISLASLDEFYQTFIPGREGKYQDVIIDNLGITFGYYLVHFFMVFKKDFFSRFRIFA